MRSTKLSPFEHAPGVQEQLKTQFRTELQKITVTMCVYVFVFIKNKKTQTCSGERWSLLDEQASQRRQQANRSADKMDF